MELRQLKYFVRAAELLNFTKAADELFITQSTLSHQIKELETKLKSQLFDRIGKRVKLTEAGKLFLDHARKTIRTSEEGLLVLRDLDNQKTGSVCIGATYGMTELLISTLAEFGKEFPDIQIQIVFGSTDDLLQKISLYQIDCMLSFLPVSSKNELLEITALFSSRLSLIVHRSHSWSNLNKISLQKITTLPLALPSSGYSIRISLDNILCKNALKLNIKIETNDIHSLLELTNTQQWSTILMNSSLFGYPELKAIPLEGKTMMREATIAFPKEVYRKKALISFYECVQQQCKMFRERFD
ncbi:LysR family transcriptional regulator [Flavobacterium sp. Sd200]|uniref:LysR family transcriptional regulator n=1 Tax=Flavobacterium sp. Sd200 TaxID=2692211 RepID=UPI00136C20A9|nr:LysR family transcriptional regulator [Flavobacterium sp. Sd200]MXN90833.1 LysR family transcriptional regulator [Flavobacterium sp. Sd200]